MAIDNTNLSKAMDALGLTELSAEEQEALLLDLNSLIFRGSMIRLIERMDDTARDEFTKLMDSGADEEAVEAFLAERVPDADSAVLDTVKELSDDILAATGT